MSLPRYSVDDISAVLIKLRPKADLLIRVVTDISQLDLQSMMQNELDFQYFRTLQGIQDMAISSLVNMKALARDLEKIDRSHIDITLTEHSGFYETAYRSIHSLIVLLERAVDDCVFKPEMADLIRTRCMKATNIIHHLLVDIEYLKELQLNVHNNILYETT